MSTEPKIDTSGRSRPAASVQESLTVETLENIAPLDDQFGAAKPKTVPEVLFEPLFGQPDQPEAQGTILHTYAILDAAKVINLVETLEMSGLDHRCLFKGKAEDDLKNVAPWLVKLKEGERFTRTLFTKDASDAPWHLWDKEPGIYIRSPASLDALWQHFRKFTRVQAKTGKWFFLRFYDPSFLPAYLGAMDPKKQRLFMGPAEAIIAITANRGSPGYNSVSLSVPPPGEGAANG